MIAILPGLLTGFSLIIAIGAQNAFVIRQGLRREHVLLIVLICAISDAALILVGTGGLGRIIQGNQIALEIIALGFGCASTSETLPSEIDVSLKEGEKICQTKKVLGTKIPEKFCYTKQELERIEEQSRETLEKAQRTGERMRTQEILGTSGSQ